MSLVGAWRSLGYGKWTRPNTLFMMFDFCLNLLKNLPHLLSQLSHDGVDPGEACRGVRPLGERVAVVVPRDLGKIFLFSIFSIICLLLVVAPRDLTMPFFTLPFFYLFFIGCCPSESTTV